MLLLAAASQADTVWLDNGDRLTGTITSLDGGILLVQSPYADDIRVKFEHVKALQSDTELVVRDATLEHDYRAKLVRADKDSVVLNGVERTDDGDHPVNADVPLKALKSVTRPTALTGEGAITGKLNLGLNRTASSTNSEDYAADLQAQARYGLWRHEFDAGYHRSKDDNSVGTDNYGMDYTLDRFLSEKAFWQARVLDRRDWVADVSRQTAYGTGPGYQFWDDALGAFSLSGLLGRVNYGYDDGTSQSSYSTSLRWDYTRYLSGKEFELYTKGELLRPLGGAANISVNGEAGVQYNLNHWLSLYLKYARNQVSGGRQSINESIYSTGVGLNW